MDEVLLTGIRNDTPIGAMAAFALLRLNSAWRLGWKGQFATLYSPERLDRDLVVAELTRIAGTRPEQRHEFSWTRTLNKLEPALWEEAARAAPDNEARGWMAALGTSVGGEFFPTPFDMTSGSQKFIDELAALPKAVTAAAVQEALFGPWLYRDATHSLGWDPAMMRAGAFTWVQPRELKKERGVTAAVWLASESLPLFPCFVDENGKRVVRGWSGDEFQWPVWDRPVTLAGLRALIRNPWHAQVSMLFRARKTKAGRQPGFSPARAISAD